ncbi:ATP-binding protein [Actinoplanes sp. NPDC051513]|uniref:ATP-binding protein n=1 Tax=Actinoplanes sp. NPDC051513 TaxID=3363908 RepID=UPI0037A07D69
MDALRLPFSDAGEGAKIRRSAAELLTGQSPDLVEDVLLVITELVDNVVQHTEDGGELRLSRDNGTVLVEVHDRSRSFPRLQRQDLRRPGGRGLLLVAALTETWGSRPTETGKLVWARLGDTG